MIHIVKLDGKFLHFLYDITIKFRITIFNLLITIHKFKKEFNYFISDTSSQKIYNILSNATKF